MSTRHHPSRVRRLVVVGGTAIAIVAATPGVATAHGLAGRADLPVPVSYFIVAAAIALVASFALLGMAWREPRLQVPLNRPLTSQWITRTWPVLRVLGLVAFATVLLSGFLDRDVTGRNISPVIVWVVFWLVVPFVSVVAGNWYRHLNPWRQLADGLRIGRVEHPDLLERVGIWPATVAFVVFTWFELVSLDTELAPTLSLALVVYTLYLFGMMAWAGRDTGLAIGDAFTSYNGVISKISPIGGHDGQVVWRGWLRGLPGIAETKGLTAFVVAMIGTVTYDGLSQSEWWVEAAGTLRRNQLFNTAVLLATVVVIGLLYLGASWVAKRVAGVTDVTTEEMAAKFAHTLVPIAFAYAFAHYFSLVLFEGQQLLHRASDPFDRGWDLFGTATWRVEVFLPVEAIWYIQVAIIIMGHIAGVTLAHDKALAEFDERVAIRTQYAMLVLMVGLTVLGLQLLAG